MRHRLALASVVVVCVTLGLTGGCENRAERVHPPAIDASAAGRDAIAHYDANQDGAISGEELEEAPALKAALKQLDADGNRQLIAGEITDGDHVTIDATGEVFSFTKRANVIEGELVD